MKIAFYDKKKVEIHYRECVEIKFYLKFELECFSDVFSIYEARLHAQIVKTLINIAVLDNNAVRK